MASAAEVTTPLTPKVAEVEPYGRLWGLMGSYGVAMDRNGWNRMSGIWYMAEGR